MAALASAFGPIVFLAMTATAHIMRGNYDWVRQTISELALGADGWIAVASFLTLAVIIAILALRLLSNMQRRRGLKTAIVFLVLIGIGFMLIGIFPTDPKEAPLTLHNLVHQGAVRVIASLFPFACFLLAPSLRADRRWRPLFVHTLVAGALALGLDILWVATPDFLDSRLGLYERVLAGNALVWMEVMAVRLLVLSRQNTKNKISASRPAVSK